VLTRVLKNPPQTQPRTRRPKPRAPDGEMI
jgi:hypothetical protein